MYSYQIKEYLKSKTIQGKEKQEYADFKSHYDFVSSDLEGLSQEELIKFQFIRTQWVKTISLYYTTFHESKRYEQNFENLKKYLKDEGVTFSASIERLKDSFGDKTIYKIKPNLNGILPLIKFTKTKFDFSSPTIDFKLKHFKSIFGGYISLEKYAPIIKSLYSFESNAEVIVSTRPLRKKAYTFTEFRPTFTNDYNKPLAIIQYNSIYYPIDLALYNKFNCKGQLSSTNNVHSNLLYTSKSIDRSQLVDLQNLYLRHKVDLTIPNHKKAVSTLQNQMSEWFHSFFCEESRNYLRDSNQHKFVISNTKGLENFDFGRKLELAVFNYLHDKSKNLEPISYKKLHASIHRISENLAKEEIKYPNIVWINKDAESFKPYDISCNIGKNRYIIEVKASRDSDNSIIYFSVEELRKAIEYKQRYIVARGVIIEDDKPYNGIILKDDFCLTFYQFTNEAISEIEKSIDEWKDYFETNKIRISINHLKSIDNPWINYNSESTTDSHKIDKLQLIEFIRDYYFDDIYRLIDTYNFKDIIDEMVNFSELEAKVNFILSNPS